MSHDLIIGVCGAGTMGSGIAQLAAQSGAETLLYDPDAGAREKALERIRAGVAKTAAKGRADADAADRVTLVSEIGSLAPCDLVIEAAPESLELKRDLFREVAGAAGAECILATNTSSLSVTEIAAGVPYPERVVGMHFFNPPPVMALLEVVAGRATSKRALAAASEVGEAMGKHVIEATDAVGFIVNRCNRPFGLEALRLLQEGIATVEQIDRIVRMGGGFRMGPFELMDLVGVDVGFEVARSFYAQSFGEPRWRPSPLAAQMVASGHHGRKTGRGWYAYPGGPPADPELPEPEPVHGLVVIAGEIPLAHELAHAAMDAGWEIARPDEAHGEIPFLILDCGTTEEDPPLQGAPQAILCDAGPLAALDPEGSAVGFFTLPPLGRLVELTRSATSSDAAAHAAEHFFASLGMHAEWVRDAPGLVLGRIVCQLVNEACFTLGERIGSAGDIDVGMVLGLNHPRGPLAWADSIGPGVVLATLVGLQEEYREERYRPAPALVAAVREGTTLSG